MFQQVRSAYLRRKRRKESAGLPLPKMALYEPPTVLHDAFGHSLLEEADKDGSIIVTDVVAEAEDKLLPIPEDERPSIPSDPMFVTALIDEANKDSWTVALENWFKDPVDPEVEEAKSDFMAKSEQQAAEINA